MNRFRKHIRKKFLGYEPEVNDLWLHESWIQTERLLNKKNESRDRLVNFEPDADDAFIDEKWKAIIPYLPEEKKRRAVFYIPTGCLLPGVLLLAMALFFILYPVIDGTETATGLPERSIRKYKGADVPKLQKQWFQGKKSTTKVPGSAATGPVAIGFNNNTMQSANKKVRYHPSSIVPDKTLKLFPVLEEGTGRELVLADSFCVLHPVDCFPARSVSDSLVKWRLVVRDSVPAKKESRLIIDVAAGMAQLYSTVQFDSLPGMSGRKTAFCLSAALHYKPHQRLLLSTQFGVTDNRYNYRSADTQNFILSRTPVATSSMPGSIDSSIQYIPFERFRRLQSTFSCQVGAGMEVQLFNRNKLSLSAGLLLQLSMTQFKYQYSYQPTGDTLSYTKHTSSPPLPNTTQITEPESRSTTFLKANLGVCPGLVIGYRISNSIDLIAKPAVYVDLKELKPLHVNYKQTNFLLTAGVRIKL